MAVVALGGCAFVAVCLVGGWLVVDYRQKRVARRQPGDDEGLFSD